jgi:hypothetical protein
MVHSTEFNYSIMYIFLGGRGWQVFVTPQSSLEVHYCTEDLYVTLTAIAQRKVYILPLDELPKTELKPNCWQEDMLTIKLAQTPIFTLTAH